MTNNFGNTGYGSRTEEYVQNKNPKITQEFCGTEAEVRATSSLLYNYGWDVTIKNGNPWTGEATIQATVSGNSPITGSSTTSSISATSTPTWTLTSTIGEKELLHCNTKIVPWISQLTDYQKSILEVAISNPPTGSLYDAYPNFNSGSSLYGGGYTAGDIVWRMARQGFRTVPVLQKILKFSISLPSGSDLTYYGSDELGIYTKSTLLTQVGVPANLYTIMPQDTNPSSGSTDGIPYYYGWQKQPVDIQRQGNNDVINLEWKYGLWPQNIFGAAK